MSAPWWCPVCHDPLVPSAAGRSLACAAGHSFDVARQGYVNLLRSGRRRPPGDSAEMVAARRDFLVGGNYQPVSDALNSACLGDLSVSSGGTVLDVGCGEGYYTRRLAAALADVPSRMCGIDVAKPGVATAAAAHRVGYYAVASAFEIPVPPASIDLLVSVFGPVAPDEFGRVVRTGGVVVAAHPGPSHLFALRELVYESPAPHTPKDPLRAAAEWFVPTGQTEVRYPLILESADQARQLLTMTPYRWHAPRDIDARLEAAGGFAAPVDVVISTYRRR